MREKKVHYSAKIGCNTKESCIYSKGEACMGLALDDIADLLAPEPTVIGAWDLLMGLYY